MTDSYNHYVIKLLVTIVTPDVDVITRMLSLRDLGYLSWLGMRYRIRKIALLTYYSTVYFLRRDRSSPYLTTEYLRTFCLLFSNHRLQESFVSDARNLNALKEIIAFASRPKLSPSPPKITSEVVTDQSQSVEAAASGTLSATVPASVTTASSFGITATDATLFSAIVRAAASAETSKASEVELELNVVAESTENPRTEDLLTEDPLTEDPLTEDPLAEDPLDLSIEISLVEYLIDTLYDQNESLSLEILLNLVEITRKLPLGTSDLILYPRLATLLSQSARIRQGSLQRHSAFIQMDHTVDKDPSKPRGRGLAGKDLPQGFSKRSSISGSSESSLTIRKRCCPRLINLLTSLRRRFRKEGVDSDEMELNTASKGAGKRVRMVGQVDAKQHPIVISDENGIVENSEDRGRQEGALNLVNISKISEPSKNENQNAKWNKMLHPKRKSDATENVKQNKTDVKNETGRESMIEDDVSGEETIPPIPRISFPRQDSHEISKATDVDDEPNPAITVPETQKSLGSLWESSRRSSHRS